MEAMIEYIGGEPILTFDGEHRFLSNFYPSAILYRGHTWPMVEHAYQAAKFTNLEYQHHIRLAPTPGVAKRLGRSPHKRSDWDSVKVGIMFSLLQLKFQIPELRGQLLATGDRWLEEGNSWGDTFWGVCPRARASAKTPWANR